MWLARFSSWFAIASLLGTLGCGIGEPTQFAANRRARLSAELVTPHAEQIDDLLREWFGTPDAPQLPPADGIERLMTLDNLQLAAGPVESHTVGITHGLYRRHCARCHGVSGDGYGPTARYQAPYPRNFQPGIFKFKSSARGMPPTEEDLLATLQHGLPGTAMPSFALLTDVERQALVQYVRYLSIRGQTETALINFIADELDYDPATNTSSDQINPEEAISLLNEVVDSWLTTTSLPVEMVGDAIEVATEAQVAAGKALFHNPKRANCVACHGSAGQGGIVLEERDYWSQQLFDFERATDLMTASLASLEQQIADTPSDRQDVLLKQQAWLSKQLRARRQAAEGSFPPHTSQPRRLAQGVARGLRNRSDLYRSLSQGIEGSAMPGVGEILTDEEIDNLITYVESIMAKPYIDLPVAPAAELHVERPSDG